MLTARLRDQPGSRRRLYLPMARPAELADLNPPAQTRCEDLNNEYSIWPYSPTLRVIHKIIFDGMADF